jgi:hypothetical protein
MHRRHRSALRQPAAILLPPRRRWKAARLYSLYHWDGPGAICHLDALLSLPRLDAIQWQPGAGDEPQWQAHWWPTFHRLLDAGKRPYIYGGGRAEPLALKREFGEQCKQMLLTCRAETAGEARELVRLMEL